MGVPAACTTSQYPLDYVKIYVSSPNSTKPHKYYNDTLTASLPSAFLSLSRKLTPSLTSTLHKTMTLSPQPYTASQ